MIIGFLKKYQLWLIILPALLLLSSFTYGSFKIHDQQKRILLLEQVQKEEQERKNRLDEKEQYQEKLNIQHEEEVRIKEDQENAEREKQNKIARCKEKQSDCCDRIKVSKENIASEQKGVNIYEDQLKGCEKSYCNKDVLKAIHRSIEMYQLQKKEGEEELNQLLAGDCKDYHKSCE